MWAMRVRTVLVSTLLLGGVLVGVAAPAAHAACPGSSTRTTSSTIPPSCTQARPVPKRKVCVEPRYKRIGKYTVRAGCKRYEYR